jgi:hypothetical protein
LFRQRCNNHATFLYTGPGHYTAGISDEQRGGAS